MSNAPVDPFALWREMLSQWEKGANEYANRATESDAFAEGMHKLMGTSLSAKKFSDELSTRMLVALNLPSRADVEALGERLASIEDRLIEVTRALEQLTGGASMPRAALPSPKRTRKPPPDEPVAAPAPVVTAPAKKKKARRK